LPGNPEPRGTVARNLDLAAAIEALRAADPILREIIDRVGADGLGDPRAGRPHDHYGGGGLWIVGQQLSNK